MTTTTFEKFVLGALNLNDGTNFNIESLTFTPAQKRPQLASNADSDGEVLVREAHYTNSYFEGMIRVAPQSSSSNAMAKLAEITDAIQECDRTDGGSPLEWTPHETETTYTAYAEVGELEELPIEATGEGAGWLISAPVVKVKLTCRPFLYGAERTAKASTESGAEPLQIVYVGGIKGDVPAEARLLVKDTATQNRRYAAWGRDVVESESNPALLLTAASLVTTEFSGEAKTRSGAYPSEGENKEKVKRATAVTSATTMAGTGRIKNVGSYGVYLRVYTGSENARFRISYRNGDGPLIPLRWKQPPVIEGFSEIYMGEVTFDEASLGEQTGEIRVEVKSAEGAIELDLNYLFLWPVSKVAGKARNIANNEPTKLLAYDYFEQTVGSNLEGNALGYPSATTWGETNKTGASGFEIGAEHCAQRGKVSDANLNSGCFAQAGATSYTTFSASCQVLSSLFRREATQFGLLGRYASTEKWVVAVLYVEGSHPAKVTLRVIKNVSGVVTVLASGNTGIGTTGTGTAREISGSHALTLAVTASGTWKATCNGLELSGQDSALAAGGALASGKVGLYDAQTSAEFSFRRMDSFQLLGAEEAGRVCYSGKQIEFNPEGALRQDSTGTYDGPPDLYRGGGFYLDPAGDAEAINRIAVRMRRNDVEEESDANVTDKQSLEIKVRERYLIPRG